MPDREERERGEGGGGERERERERREERGKKDREEVVRPQGREKGGDSR